MTNESRSKSRPYRKRRRAERERKTRERITEAAVKLHGAVGPAQTTVTGIAEEAGVQRATVYRHFPDEEALFAACSAHYWAQHPPPDPGRWAAIEDPARRLPTALAELYAFFRRTEGMLEKTNRDAPLVQAMAAAVSVFGGYLDAAVDTITAGRRERGGTRERTRAAIAHAASFATWQSLVRDQGLSDGEAAALMVALVESAAGAGSLRAPPARGAQYS